ncbi:hypothetical protein Tco_0633156 [Tanacetum coccineum]
MEDSDGGKPGWSNLIETNRVDKQNKLGCKLAAAPGTPTLGYCHGTNGAVSGLDSFDKNDLPTSYTTLAQPLLQGGTGFVLSIENAFVSDDVTLTCSR